MQFGEMSRTILIVEDEFLVAMELEDIVSNAGLRVIAVASDAESAARVEHVPDIAFVDLNLRDGRTGPAIAHNLAQRFGTRIVFVTANPEQIGDPPGSALGYVQKPFSVDAILAAVELGRGERPQAIPRGLNLFN